MIPERIKEEILKRLTEHLNIFRIILFGSFAAGTQGTESDIDLLVVTDDDFMPQTFGENMRNYLKVALVLRDIKREIPVDLIVHTKPMHKKFMELGSLFSKELLSKGEILYEKSH